MRPLLLHPPARKHEDDISILNRRQSMSNHNHSPRLLRFLKHSLHRPLRLRVQVRCRFVEQQQPRISDKSPGYGDTLLLATGKSDTLRTHRGVVTVRQ